MVSLIPNKLATEESCKISAVPDKPEIEKVIFGMKTNKAPGLDGLTIEVLQICWDFVGDSCVKLIHTIWAKKKVLPADCMEVIKLIPKGGDRKLLGNWRPISLMSLTYKIVAKLLANRVKIVLPNLVDIQQTGFVQGRHISDNVLSLKIGQEWAKWTAQKALFIKLDFVKAYDRVDHRFLWKVLEGFGFDSTFISLVQGLNCNGAAKVHINQAFSEEITVRRGVRQGCPLAPLLFALCSQPFMSMLRRAELAGRIRGLQIAPGKSLLHQLFADDTGICIEDKEEYFTELQLILNRYELASGARINIQKSLVMPLGQATVPDWVRTIGCEVAKGRRHFKYLGICVGVEVSDGKARKALVAWKKMIRPKQHGGLGLFSFEDRASSLQMRHATDILDNKPVEWVWMASRMIKIKLLLGPQKREREQWDGMDAMLLLSALRMPDAPTVDRILKVWFSFKPSLGIDRDRIEVPKYLHIRNLKILWQLTGRGQSEDFKILEDGAMQFRLKTVSDLVDSSGAITLENLRTRLGHVERDLEDEEGIWHWLCSLRTTDTKLVKVGCWTWQGKWPVGESWRLPAAFWSNLIEKQKPSFGNLNRYWGMSTEPATWLTRWKQLWQGASLPRHKIGLWRFLQQGFATLHRAAKWHVSDGICRLCRNAQETLIHLVWECSCIQERVRWVAEVISVDNRGLNSFGHTLDVALRLHRQQPMALILLWLHCSMCWKERNKVIFDNTLTRLSIGQMIQGLKAFTGGVCRQRRGEVGDRMKASIEEFFLNANSVWMEHRRRNRVVISLLQEEGISLSTDGHLYSDAQDSSSNITLESSSDSSTQNSASVNISRSED
ncbi:hypothetical protein R1sor_015869 [Riccia sorocarpa]|uniref:Reverse transcriptase domain-containing protein n=1 Tax=Riccia sorocarpa TaxID=122646 RepID=A0ABD3HGU6_9MARC